ncbi:MAG: adenosylcobinamide-GDP ribazoletransferase [Actinomycetota bacterium]|nr:adenosylcobinamide-GDP ribazoletransferase [Actinomycetota bacterium]
MPDKTGGRRVNRRGPLQPVGEAVRFLTAFPVRGIPPSQEETIARSVSAFPLVGLLIGACGVGAGLLAGWMWGDPLRAVVVVVAWMVVMGEVVVLLTLAHHMII